MRLPEGSINDELRAGLIVGSKAVVFKHHTARTRMIDPFVDRCIARDFVLLPKIPELRAAIHERADETVILRIPCVLGILRAEHSHCDLARELQPLRVNAVAPGVIDTPWWDWATPEQKSAYFADFAKRTPVGRVGTPEEIGQAIVFLITNGFMTGQTIVCDGGIRLS